MKTEKDLQNYLKKACVKAKVLFYKTEAVGQRGFPDCFLAKNGAVCLVELKSPAGTGSLEPLQVATINRLAKEGLWVEVVSSKAEADNVVKLLTNATA